MTRTAPINVAASMHRRLLNAARARGERFHDLLVRFGTERLLHRLARSPHRDRFVLKGAILLAAWHGRQYRSTRDADLLGSGDPSPEALEAVFRDICTTPPAEPDGLVFDTSSVSAAQIREDNVYGGVRVRLVAHLGKTEIALQADVGFGDVVTPAAEPLQLPTLLPMTPTTLAAYTRETVVAEKLEAIVKLGEANSRLKDYYDLWVLLREDTDRSRLRRAVTATFARRGTPLPDGVPVGLTNRFAEDDSRRRQWEAFLAKSRTSERPSFPDVATTLRTAIMPILEALRASPGA